MEQHPEAGGLATVTRADGYAVVVEWAETNWSAYAPDVPGCVSTGDTPDEAIANMRDALAFHFEGLREDGESIPEPRTLVATVAPDIVGLASGGATGDAEETAAASGVAPRQSSAITDARRVGLDASVVLGSCNAATDIAHAFDSLGSAANIAAGANAAAGANFVGMLPRIDLSAFGGGALGIASITASLNTFGASQLPTIDIASIFGSPSLAETMRDFTQVRWSDQWVPVETPLAKLLADSPMQRLINTYATDSLAEMSRLVAKIALESPEAEDTSIYLVENDRHRKVYIVAERRSDEEDTFTGIQEGEKPDNLSIFGQWCKTRVRRLG